MYPELADRACQKITAGITRKHADTTRIKALLDPYNPAGSTNYVNFNTSRDVWETDARRCHVNYVVTDSEWESEFCRVAESHPQVRAYVKNHNLGLEVPYLLGPENHRYIPDFIVQIDDGQEDPLNLIIEIKGYRGEDAKVKKTTMEVYWIPGVNNLGQYGRWSFAEFTDAYAMEEDFATVVAQEFNAMVDLAIELATTEASDPVEATE
jgi:type III restriction enzyme